MFRKTLFAAAAAMTIAGFGAGAQAADLSCSTAKLIVPNDSARCGLEFVLQALVYDPTVGPLSFGSISNALLETMGS